MGLGMLPLSHAALQPAKPIVHTPVSATSPQGAYSGAHTVKQAIDGSMESPNWHIPSTSRVEGEFTFAAPVRIDVMHFASASFSTVTLELKRAGKWSKARTFTLPASRLLRFPKGLSNVEAVRAIVKDKAGKKFSFSLREIEFLQQGETPNQEVIKKVFTDLSCSKLRSNATAADIAALPKELQSVAKKIKKGEYEGGEFRIGSYRAFSAPELARDIQKINALNPFDNPTGIYAKAGEEIYVLVGPTHGSFVDLICNKAFSLQRTTYPLVEGINKVKITQPGLLYISYNTDLAKNPKPKPVNVHFLEGSGTVNGYFDIAKHDDADWKRLIAKATADVFDIVGKQSMMILTTKHLQQYSPDKISESVKFWDAGVRAIWDVMGFNKYKDPINNRMLGFSTEGGAHMFSTEYGCGYSNGSNGHTLKNEVIAPGIVQGKRSWGYGHEVGHSHQAAFNWPSMTESSNNFFAQLILDRVLYSPDKNPTATDMENPCKYLLEQGVKGVPFHDMNGWAQWGFAQYSFYLYFHKLGINPQFYPDLFESLRKNPVNAKWSDPARIHLDWYIRICNETKTDFTEDFEIFNWFVPIDVKKHQYGDYHYKLTKEMADAAKALIKAKGYPKPKYRIAFMHQHGKTVNLWGKTMSGPELNGYWTKYKADGKLSLDVKASKQGDLIKVTDGENAAAFCVKTDGKVVGYFDRPQFSIAGLPWNASSEVYAIPMQTAKAYKLIYKAK